MGNLYAFTFAGKQDSMIADNIAAADCGKADSLMVSRSSLALTTIDSYLLQIATHSDSD